MTLFNGDEVLIATADRWSSELRAPFIVMQPDALGAARLTAHNSHAGVCSSAVT